MKGHLGGKESHLILIFNKEIHITPYIVIHDHKGVSVQPPCLTLQWSYLHEKKRSIYNDPFT